MCGRFYIDQKIIKQTQRAIGNLSAEFWLVRMGDVYPSERTLVITGEIDGSQRRLCPIMMTWGWKYCQGNGLVINARVESVLEKPMFSASVLQRRCVIPAGHFYEWNRLKEKAVFKTKDLQTMYLAGIYQIVDNEARFTILTTSANPSVKPVHDRMPVILAEEELKDWLFDEQYMKVVLKRVPVMLEREQEFEQLSLF